MFSTSSIVAAGETWRRRKKPSLKHWLPLFSQNLTCSCRDEALPSSQEWRKMESILGGIIDFRKSLHHCCVLYHERWRWFENDQNALRHHSRQVSSFPSRKAHKKKNSIIMHVIFHFFSYLKWLNNYIWQRHTFWRKKGFDSHPHIHNHIPDPKWPK